MRKIQIPLKVNDLLDYSIQVREKKFEFPSHRECCPICHCPNCAVGHGFYYRPAYTRDNRFIKKLPIKRGFCQKFGVTFSYLPQQLIPYSKYPVMFVTEVLGTWVKSEKNVYETMANISSSTEEQDEISDEIGTSHIYHFRKIFELAKEKFILWKKRERTYKVERFIRYCEGYRPEQSEGLGLKYYTDNGGYIRNSHFLFGVASQFR